MPEADYREPGVEIKPLLTPEMLLIPGYGYLDKLTGLQWAIDQFGDTADFVIPPIYKNWQEAKAARARGKRIIARGYYPGNPVADNLFIDTSLILPYLVPRP